jgi:ATP-dependent DNA helicase RecG
MERARRNEPGLTNADIRYITHFDRNQVLTLMHELIQCHPQVSMKKAGKYTRYEYGNGSGV